jgi:HK97 family phage portal protein
MAHRAGRKPAIRKPRQRRGVLADYGATDDYWYRPIGMYSSSGENVTPDSAMKLSVVYACVNVLATSIASLPLKVYRSLPTGGKAPAPDHPLWKVLHDQPNGWQTSFEFREMMMWHLVLRGNAYAFIVAPAGTVEQLIPIHPDRVKVERLLNGRLRYQVKNEQTGQYDPYTQDEIFHLRGPSLDGIVGVSVITYARESMGEALATETYGATYFGNGARPGIVLTTEQKLNAEQMKLVREQWNSVHQGPANAHKTAVMSNGLKPSVIGVTNEDSQFIELRGWKIADLCRWFRMQPHKVHDLSRATFSNIEEQNIEHVSDTLRPWGVRWEQTIKRDLITEPEVFAEINFDGLLRGNTQARALALQTRFINGNLSADEWREIENQNPIPDGHGDRYFVQRNLIPVDKIDEQFEIDSQQAAGQMGKGNPPEEPEDESPEEDAAESEDDPEEDTQEQESEAALAVQPITISHDAEAAFDCLIVDASERIANAEIRDMEDKAKRADEDPARFKAWSDDFYANKHRTYVTRQLAPIIKAFRLQGVTAEGVSELLCGNGITSLGGVDPVLVVNLWKTNRAKAVESIIRKVCKYESA